MSGGMDLSSAVDMSALLRPGRAHSDSGLFKPALIRKFHTSHEAQTDRSAGMLPALCVQPSKAGNMPALRPSRYEIFGLSAAAFLASTAARPIFSRRQEMVMAVHRGWGSDPSRVPLSSLAFPAWQRT